MQYSFEMWLDIDQDLLFFFPWVSQDFLVKLELTILVDHNRGHVSSGTESSISLNYQDQVFQWYLETLQLVDFYATWFATENVLFLPWNCSWMKTASLIRNATVYSPQNFVNHRCSVYTWSLSPFQTYMLQSCVDINHRSSSMVGVYTSACHRFFPPVHIPKNVFLVVHIASWIADSPARSSYILWNAWHLVAGDNFPDQSVVTFDSLKGFFFFSFHAPFCSRT